MRGRSGLAAGFPEPPRKHCPRQLVAIPRASVEDDQEEQAR
jgi:hypothetical protein